MPPIPTYPLAAMALACGVLLSVLPFSGSCSGFAVPELSIAGLGTSNALVANAKELGAIPYNPAAMAFHEYSAVAAGILGVVPDLAMTNVAGQSFDSDAASPVGLPQLQAHYRGSDKWSFGITVNTPFGLETNWPLAAFAGQFPAPAALAATQPNRTKLELLAVSPSFAYRVNQHLSFAAGFDYYDLREVIFNSVGSKLHGDGTGIGFNLSTLIQHDQWSFGASFRSSPHIGIDGAIEGVSAARTDIDLPRRFQVGVRHQTTDQLAIEMDISHTGWSSFNQLIIRDARFSSILLSSVNEWTDATAYRLGATYDLSAATQFRFGYTFDETPQAIAFFSARIPDADRHLFNVGVGHDLGNGWGIEAGYMYVRFQDRSIKSTTPQTTGDPNGTSSVNGHYESSVHLFGIGVAKTFI